MEFYRVLVPDAISNDIRVVALFPDETSQARDYLSATGLAISEIQQSNLASLGITSTPTVLLVNKDGVIQHAWEGKIPATFEPNVLLAVSESSRKYLTTR
jgi:hypothetical protein